MRSSEPHIEASPAPVMLCDAVKYQAVGLARQCAIGMKKKQYFTARNYSAGIHLHRAAARCAPDPVGQRRDARDAIIAAAAIDYDYFSAAPAQRLQPLEGGADDPGFVEAWNDDRKLGCCHMHWNAVHVRIHAW